MEDLEKNTRKSRPEKEERNFFANREPIGEKIKNHQANDEDLQKKVKILNDKSDPNFKKTAKNYGLNDNGILFWIKDCDKQPRLVIPESLKTEAIALFHDQKLAGHFGREKNIFLTKKTVFLARNV